MPGIRLPAMRLSAIRLLVVIAMVAAATMVPAALAPAGPPAARSGAAALAGISPAQASLPSSDWEESVVFAGLVSPTNVEFAPDGRIFVAEKRGTVKVFDNLADTTPSLFADLSANVHNYYDRGLLGLALPPNFPSNPWVYVLYAYDAPPGQVAPYWNDVCASATTNGCLVTGRLSRLQASGNVMTGSEQVLIHDWCQQFTSHSVGDIHFGPDGALYATSGDGASFNAVDSGALGAANMRCVDPANEGGALRAQDVRTGADPAGLDGALLRLNPATGAAMAGNPAGGSADPNTARIITQGLRNPFRFTFRPGTSEIWVGDVGWATWEEIDRLVNPTAGVANFGWPCYEGAGRNSAYDGANLPVCESLYSTGGVSAPYYTYHHANKVVAGEVCPTGSSSITGLAFYPASGGSFPAAYAGALFFSDYSRDCIWVMKAPPGGLPNPATIETFAPGAANPVDLTVGPGGDLYYLDLPGGTLRRIRYTPSNHTPVPVIGATVTSGAAPLQVGFSAASSTDPDPADQGLLRYAWDFTSDGTVDSTAVNPTYTYPTPGNYTARLTVTDPLGANASDTQQIGVSVELPSVVIDTPDAAELWRTGDLVNFTGHAYTSAGDLPASRLTWRLRLNHCSTLDNCHVHQIQEWSGVAGGSFVAPDHEYPAYLELELTATTTAGTSGSAVRRLDPRLVNLTFAANHPGLALVVGSTSEPAPFTRTVIVGSTVGVVAPTPQVASKRQYDFAGWSDGGEQTHTFTAPAGATTITANYIDAGPVCKDSFGYTCNDGVRAFVPADQNVVALTGDDVSTQIQLPFPINFYGTSYTRAWLDTNGVVSFAPLPTPISAWNQTSLPSPPAEDKADLAVYPYWSDLIVDSQASVRTAVIGGGRDRRFVVEWRNVKFWADQSRRVSFEVIFTERSSVITFAYRDIDATDMEQGSIVTVGIENATGTVALQYSYNQVILQNGRGVTFTPPQVRRPS